MVFLAFVNLIPSLLADNPPPCLFIISEDSKIICMFPPGILFWGCLGFPYPPVCPLNGSTSTAGANALPPLKYCSLFIRSGFENLLLNTVQVFLRSELWVYYLFREGLCLLCTGYLFSFPGFKGDCALQDSWVSEGLSTLYCQWNLIEYQ